MCCMECSHHILNEVHGYNVNGWIGSLYLVIELCRNNECLHWESVLIL